MSELSDSFIKLFGKTIAFPPNDCVAASASASDQNLCSASDSERPEQELEKNQDNSIDQEVSKENSDEPSKDNQEDESSEKVMAKNNDNPKTPSADVEASLLKASKNGEEEEEGDDKGESDAQGKTLKKPDKILPCPRCTSMDTKFCYYNNYNVNQPRHFCKNCQRYWTAGGTMRNVPVGAGRRKNKNNATASHYRHIMVSEALQMARMSNAAAANGSVLTFGSDEKSQHRVQNVLYRPDDDHSSGCGSSVTASNSSERVQESAVKFLPPQVQCFPGPPWPCPWNSVQYHSPIHQAAYPVPFYPAPPYWGCAVPGSWNAPLAPPNPTVLGKHSRTDSEKQEPTSEKNSGRSVLIPKTLRIDDPSEAAKSSIWATLGIRNEKTSGGLFKSFQSGNDKDQGMGASAAIHANPAALSRSLNFQENT